MQIYIPLEIMKRIDSSCWNHTTGFLANQHSPLAVFRKVEDCFRSQLPFKGRNSFQIFQLRGVLARTRVPVPQHTHMCKCNSQHTFFRTSNQNLFLLSLDTHSNLRSMWNGKLENWKLPLPIQIGVEQIGNRQEVLNYYWEDLFVFAFRLTNQLLWLCK